VNPFKRKVSVKIRRDNAAVSAAHRNLMRGPLQLGVVLLLAMAGSQCHSTTAPKGSISIANLTAVELGLEHQVCGGLFEYAAVDEVNFDVMHAQRTDVVGMAVYQNEVPIGTVAECPVTPACSETKACLISSNGQTHAIRLRAVVPWTSSYTWAIRLNALTGTTTTNVLSTTIQRPDALPTGTQAVFLLFTATRTLTTSANFELEAYSPGIAGRSIVFTMTATSNGSVVTNTSNTQQETAGSHKLGLFGGFRIASGPTDITATLTERDAAGNVIAQDTRTITVQ